jgi:hypothetical protein
MLFKRDYPGLGANRGYAQPRSQCSTRQFWSMPIQPRSFEFHRFSFVKFDAATFRRQNTDGATKFLRLANNVFHRRKLG